MYLISEDIHDPFFCIVALQTGNGPIVLHAEKDLSSLKIRQGHNFLRQLLRTNIVTFEFDTGVLPVSDYLQEFTLKHSSPR